MIKDCHDAPMEASRRPALRAYLLLGYTCAGRAVLPDFYFQIFEKAIGKEEVVEFLMPRFAGHQMVPASQLRWLDESGAAEK
jgi:hypothetical protein